MHEYLLLKIYWLKTYTLQHGLISSENTKMTSVERWQGFEVKGDFGPRMDK